MSHILAGDVFIGKVELECGGELEKRLHCECDIVWCKDMESGGELES